MVYFVTQEGLAVSVYLRLLLSKGGNADAFDFDVPLERSHDLPRGHRERAQPPLRQVTVAVIR